MARATLADRYRAHREAFVLAQELGCTPKEAEQELRRRAARACEAASVARMAAKDAASSPSTSSRNWEAPWMMRD